jgi:hypothetical protein
MTHIRTIFVFILIFILSAIGSYFIMYVSKKDNEKTQLTQTEQPKKEREPNRWKSSELNMPAGTVVGSGYLESSPSSNWLSIKTLDGPTTIVKNLDWQTHSAITVGDIIE